jgi:hypothetical protein
MFLARCARVIGVFFLTAATFAGAQARQSHAAPQSVTPGSITSTTIPPDYFDMTAEGGVLDGTPWPTMPIFGLRLWDTDTAWADINTADGVYDWTTLDSWIAAAAANNDQLMYTFGQTPAWASSDAKDANCDYEPGSCWPPSDLNSDGTGSDQYWINFVSAIAQHAPSIQYWEMWNTPHDPNQWNGTNAQLVRMVEDANTYIKKYIPTAVIISPANGQLNYTFPAGNCTMPDLMAGYLAAGLGQYIDVLAFHTYYTTVPEDIIPVIQCYQSTMATYNISSMPLWSTEGAWGTDSELPSATQQAGFVARLYLLLWSNGVLRHYWYAWNDTATGTLEVNGVTNTAGIAYGQVESWMSGRTMSTLCSENSSDIWTCGLSGTNGYASQAVWYANGSKSYTAPSEYINYLDLAGVEHTITPGATVTVGAEPILLQNQTTSTTGTPNFVFSETVPFPEINAGSTGTSGTVTITSQYGFTGTVNLSCPATFGANSCSITPASVSSFPATATLVINGTSFVAGTYQIAVQGTSGSLTNSLNVPFSVGDFAIAGPTTLSASSGQAVANLTITSEYAYSGQINAACNASALSGATCTVNPASPITVGSGAVVPVTATVTVPANTANGTYNISISMQDVSGAPSHSLSVALILGQSFTLGALTPPTQTVNPGQSATYNFSVQPVGGSFTNAVNFSCSGAPANTQCSFSPNPVTPGSASAPVTMTITTTASSASVSQHQRSRTAFLYTMWLALPGIVLLAPAARRSRRRKFLLPVSLLALLLLALLLASCGGVSNGGSASSTGGGGTTGGQQQGTQPGTYTITVTGASGTITQQAPTVTLVVNQ